MPAIFIGHGSPMNAIENNEFSRKWQELGKIIPKPKAIVCISAHYITQDTSVTAIDRPRTIHDFSGFPEELFKINYNAKGDRRLAEEIKNKIKSTEIKLDETWGLDHGCWSILQNMYPKADIPVIELSVNYSKDPRYHFELGKQLSFLREKGILIIASGNLVHNLTEIGLKSNDFNEEFGHPWAIKANDIFKRLITEENYDQLMNYEKLGDEIQLAVPDKEHYFPMLYILGLKDKNEKLELFNDKVIAGSISMTSFSVGM